VLWGLRQGPPAYRRFPGGPTCPQRHRQRRKLTKEKQAISDDEKLKPEDFPVHTDAMLVCHGQKGRRWFLRPPCVPDRWFPRDELDRESYAFETSFGSKVEQTHPRKIGADAWLDRREADRYELLEHTFPLPNNEILDPTDVH